MIQMSPSAIIYDKYNALYVLDHWEQQLVKINNPIDYGQNATPITIVKWYIPFTTPSLNFNATGLCIDNTDGSVFISSIDSHQVFWFNQSSSNGTSYVGDGTPGNASNQLNSPKSIVMDNQRRL